MILIRGNAALLALCRTLLAAAMAMLALVASAAPPGDDGGTFYVRSSGNDGNDGLSPSTALFTIQAAVNKCRSAGCTIYVGPGVYSEEVGIGVAGGAQAKSGEPDAPNSIIGDAEGARTGDDPGPVIISGDNVREHGLRIERRDHWRVESITLRDQTYYGVYAASSDDLRIHRCTIANPARFAVFIEGDSITISGNRIEQENASGYGVYLKAGAGLNTIAGNFMARTGPAWLSEGYADGASFGGYSWSELPNAGIIATSSRGGKPVEFAIENNIVSDYVYGIYAFDDMPNFNVRIACNSISGASHGIFGQFDKSAAVISDNIVTDSYIGVAVDQRRNGGSLSGLLAHNIRFRAVIASGVTPEGVIENVDPMWRDARGGDYALLETSPAIDAGIGASGTRDDYRGVIRPSDGDGDGDARPDLGAFEFDPSVDKKRSPRIVRWQEIRPR